MALPLPSSATPYSHCGTWGVRFETPMDSVVILCATQGDADKLLAICTQPAPETVPADDDVPAHETTRRKR